MIVNRVKELREKRMNEDDNSGIWTQEALAKRVGVTRQTIIAIERGTYNPSLELAFRLAAEFEISIEEVFNYRGKSHGT
jgi:putative transcriptional regulator